MSAAPARRDNFSRIALTLAVMLLVGAFCRYQNEIHGTHIRATITGVSEQIIGQSRFLKRNYRHLHSCNYVLKFQLPGASDPVQADLQVIRASCLNAGETWPIVYAPPDANNADMRVADGDNVPLSYILLGLGGILIGVVVIRRRSTSSFS